MRDWRESLPFVDNSFDAVMAVLSEHHWRDRRQRRELRRVARRRVVLFDADPADSERFWLTAEYLPRFLDLIPGHYRAVGAWRRELEQLLGPVRVIAGAGLYRRAGRLVEVRWSRRLGGSGIVL